MAEMQTILVIKKFPKLEEFQKENAELLVYLLEKYLVWKKLKEINGDGNGVSES